MARTGRPKKKIDREEFEKLCVLQCTLIEIAGWFDCCEDTIENWCKKTFGENFSDVYKKYSAKGKVSIRRSQFRSAEQGNVTMLIWLGKQYLDQKEPKQEVAISSESDDSILEMEKYFDERRKAEERDS